MARFYTLIFILLFTTLSVKANLQKSVLKELQFQQIDSIAQLVCSGNLTLDQDLNIKGLSNATALKVVAFIHERKCNSIEEKKYYQIADKLVNSFKGDFDEYKLMFGLAQQNYLVENLNVYYAHVLHNIQSTTSFDLDKFLEGDAGYIVSLIRENLPEQTLIDQVYFVMQNSNYPILTTREKQ